jgi:hypothetical protein
MIIPTEHDLSISYTLYINTPYVSKNTGNMTIDAHAKAHEQKKKD